MDMLSAMPECCVLVLIRTAHRAQIISIVVILVCPLITLGPESSVLSVSISASPTACLPRGYGRAGTQNDRPRVPARPYPRNGHAVGDAGILRSEGSVLRRSSMWNIFDFSDVPIGVADGMPIARRGGHFEYRHAHSRAMGMPSATPM